jgi:hypothetical protein
MRYSKSDEALHCSQKHECLKLLLKFNACPFKLLNYIRKLANGCEKIP